MIRVAYGSVPKDGGTFTFYRNLRPLLLDHGIDFRCVTVGRRETALIMESFVDEGCVVVAPRTRRLKAAAKAFSEWVTREDIDIVIGINSEPILASLPHLPAKVRCLSRCANGFDHGYKITMACAERLAKVIAITPKLENDLLEKYGAKRERLVLIPNGVSPERFEEAAADSRGQEAELRLGFLGRLEHNQKGVLHIPNIVRELNRLEVLFKLRIAGQGVHRNLLEKELKDEVRSGQVEFTGGIGRDEVPGFLARTDVFLFTSHIEGCPNALLEAMVAGCVPVSWRIEGITDFLLEDGVTGLLVPSGDCSAFAGSVACLNSDRSRLQAMGEAGARQARERFSTKRAAESYASVFREVMTKEPPTWAARPWPAFRPEPSLRQGWKKSIPRPVRAVVRRILGHRRRP